VKLGNPEPILTPPKSLLANLIQSVKGSGDFLLSFCSLANLYLVSIPRFGVLYEKSRVSRTLR
jgi:hypothetical protein